MVSDVTNLNFASYINRFLMNDTYIANALNYDPASGQGKFFAVQSQPESVVPYVKYTWRSSSDVDEWWLERGEVAYAIYDNSSSRGQYLVNLFKDRLRQGDQSAYAINKFLRENGLGDFKFHSTEYLGGDNPEPTEEEAGAVAYFCNFRVTYSFIHGSRMEPGMPKVFEDRA